MKTKVLQRRTKDILFKAELNHHVCLLEDHSGEGKSFLFRELQGAIDEDWNSHYVYVNHNNFKSVLASLRAELNSYIVVFDDFELYQDDAMRLIKANDNALFVVMCKDCFRYFGEDVGSYEIIHAEDCVLCKMK